MRAQRIGALWFDTGVISQQGTFKGAIKHGGWTYWNPRGGKQAEGTYAMGKRIGAGVEP